MQAKSITNISCTQGTRSSEHRVGSCCLFRLWKADLSCAHLPWKYSPLAHLHCERHSTPQYRKPHWLHWHPDKSVLQASPMIFQIPKGTLHHHSAATQATPEFPFSWVGDVRVQLHEPCLEWVSEVPQNKCRPRNTIHNIVSGE